MQCPSCGLYHPARYEQCVSCGSKLSLETPQPESQQEENTAAPGRMPRLRNTENAPGNKFKFKFSASIGILVTVGLFLATAGGTYFFFSRPPESDRLLNEGQKQLANGQFAFAQKTLEQAISRKRNDPKLLLTLARAYVGTDQLEKAWSCVSQAQQLGAGLMTDPQLSSDLANYYRQRNQYQRATELLRPLANENVANKKNELADLDALWGDEAFREGNIEQAMKCWEEVKTLQAGTRVAECDTRLSSIYQKMAGIYAAKNDSEASLNYLAKLNSLAPSQQSYEQSSDLYAQQGKLELAIDQLKRAIKSGSGSVELNNKLASLMAKRGKELLDAGDTDAGYGYLQQSKSLDARIKLPTVALRSVKIRQDSGSITASGEVWNPGPNAVNYLSLRADLFDTKGGKVLSSKEQRVVDEFVPPLTAQEAKAFTLTTNLPEIQEGVELKVYLDGSFYRSYPIQESGTKPTNTAKLDKNTTTASGPDSPRPNTTPEPNQPKPAPEPATTPIQAPTPSTGGLSPEERTMKDLE